MIETGMTLTIYADHDYHFKIHVEDLLSLEYIEFDLDHKPIPRQDISFGSVDEMEAVAKAMLRAVKFKREND